MNVTMNVTSARTWRALLVSLHVISAVCWLGQVIALVALLVLSASSPPGETKVAAAEMANILDLYVLGFAALIAAFTGFGLSAVTSWGYFHHWWVSAKFVLTLGQLAVGSLVLAQALPDVVTAARAGTAGPVAPVVVGLGLVAAGLALQVWLSVAKPGGRTPRGQRAQGRPSTAPVAVIAMMVVLPLVDIVLHVLASLSLPVLSPAGLIVALVVRHRRGRRRALAPGPAVADAAVALVEATVLRRRLVTPDVVSLRVTPVDGLPTPTWEPGAHIDLVLGSGKVRQYSLHGDPADRSGYDVAVLREPDGRGGSVEIHRLTEGATIGVGGPRNNFPLVGAPSYLFLAGGIGVTALLPMIEHVHAAGADWQLVYRGRSRPQMAFADDLAERHPQRVVLLPADSTARPDLTALLRALPPGSAVYCCGPRALMDAVSEQLTTAAPRATLHLERFTASAEDDSVDRPFQVVLPRTGRTVDVPAERSMLDCLRDALPDIPASCETGLCGSCEMRVLAGRPDHRDDILDGADRERTDVVYPCVSRSRDNLLVLDA